MVSSVFNVDDPVGAEEKTCELALDFPSQCQLETSSYNFTSSGSRVTEGASYTNLPGTAELHGQKTLAPGNTYTIALATVTSADTPKRYFALSSSEDDLSQGLLETLELAAQDLVIGRLERSAKPLEKSRVAAADQERVSLRRPAIGDARACRRLRASPVPRAGTRMRYKMGSFGQPNSECD
ncbi:hypothetical protein HD806DRAFT_529972 [Xylariaceae sp. AK1471]|nr:hypothetical protein HD806DRAFT_529972 [Xylariaceae sp. AK1471]